MKRYIILLSIIAVVLFFSSCESKNNDIIYVQSDNVTATNTITTEGNIDVISQNEDQSVQVVTNSDSNISNNTNDSSDDLDEKDEPINKINDSISILAAGDVMLHSSNLSSAYIKETNEYDFNPVFTYVKKYISSADFAYANLETVTAGEEKEYTSYPKFNSPDSIVEALKEAGFDGLITANNHSIDRGADGIRRTIDVIDENGLLNFGTYKEPAQRYSIVDIKDFRTAFLTYTYGCNGNINLLTEEEKAFMVNLLNEEKIKSDIDSAKNQNVDIIIVNLHWGTEYKRAPSIYQEELAKRIFEWGADVIIASHPHVIQKSETMEINGEIKYIIYSMGNFYSNYRREDKAERENKIYTEDGVMVWLQFERNNNGNVYLKAAKHIPTWVYKYYKDDKNNYRILPMSDNVFDEPFVNDNNIEMIKASYQNTFEVVEDYYFSLDE